jgi:catechol 2,3-dioxygenase-like lactoylglutathione lyase family enzyme
MTSLGTAFIFAQDAETLARFYEAGFGFPVRSWDPDWILFDAGGVDFGIHQIPREHAKSIVIEDPPRERSQGAVKLSFVVEDFAAAKARLEAAGARFRDPAPWDGPKEGDFVDPEGNVFRIREPEV